jgi:Raf kinase inhibitor-like YbhB/YbcL family protein
MGPIPVRHTCDGEDVSPALAWTGAPAGVQSFVLIVDDPDAPDPAAPKRTYVHWVLYDIPASVSTLAEGVKTADLREGMRDGSNDWKRTGYGGPCPPIGKHRYFFKLYALDRRLGNMGAATKADVQQVMANHVIETAELVGTYERPKK